MEQAIGKAVMVVFMEPVEGTEPEFNDWYNRHHVPERVSVPGILNGRRYELSDGDEAPKYLAIYELENEAVLHSDAYLQNVKDSTPMNFPRPKVQRLVYRQVFPESGTFDDKTGFPASKPIG